VDSARSPESPDRSSSVVWLDSVKTTRVRWVWRDYIPAGKITIFDGDPGVGKSIITADLAARVSTGALMVDRSQCLTGPRAVLMVGAEDDLADTVAPRLDAADADRTRIATIKLQRDDEGELRPLTIPDGLVHLREAIVESKALLVVIDPITCFLSEGINTNNDASVRRALAPLADVAAETGAAVVLIRHLNKEKGPTAVYRGGGSIGFTAAARAEFVFGKHPTVPDLFVMARTKANLVQADRAPSLGYRIVASEVDPEVPVVEWAGVVVVTADSVVGADARRHAPAREAAEDFLLELLGDHEWHSAGEIEEAAEAAGIKKATLHRGAVSLGVEKDSQRDDGRYVGWQWRLPPDTQPFTFPP
jgi:AAA domain